MSVANAMDKFQSEEFGTIRTVGDHCKGVTKEGES